MKRITIRCAMAVIVLLAACFAIPAQAVSAASNTPVSVLIPAEVRISGDGAGTDTVFHLCMENRKEGFPMPAETTLAVKGAGSVSFGPIQYDAPGDYSYRIFELQESAEHYTYDPSVFLVTVRIVSDSQGVLASEIWMVKQGDTAKSASAVFTNQYQNGAGAGTVPKKYPAVIDPPVQKKITGGVPAADSIFLFVLKADSPAYPMPGGSIGGVCTAAVYGEGFSDFGRIAYYSPGVYTYTCYEADSGAAGYTYDTSVYAMKVVVTENDGRLSAVRTISLGGNIRAEGFVFENVYTGKGTAEPGKGNNTPGKKAPRTGDDFPLGLLAVFMVTGMAGCFCVFVRMYTTKRRMS
jgi:pilin isopeptide linkage protein